MKSRKIHFILVAVVLWLGGFWGFLNQIPFPPEHLDVTTDAIVVLTGGSRRLDAGLDLLSQKQGLNLFISGVNKDVRFKELFYLNKVSQPSSDQSVELGYTAANTRENALETAAWMRKKGYTSMRLVTAHYHMPRSLMEFRAIAPEASVYPYAVCPVLFKNTDFLSRFEQIFILIGEYQKFIGAWVRITLGSLVH